MELMRGATFGPLDARLEVRKAILARGLIVTRRGQREWQGEDQKYEHESVWDRWIDGGLGSNRRGRMRKQELRAQPDGSAGGAYRPIGRQDGGEQPPDSRCGRQCAGGNQ